MFREFICFILIYCLKCQDNLNTILVYVLRYYRIIFFPAQQNVHD